MSNNKDFKVKNGIKPTVYHEAVGTVTSGVVGYYLAGASYASKSLSVTSQASLPIGSAIKSDGTSYYVIDNTTSTVYQYDLSTAWDISTGSYASKSFSVATQVAYPTALGMSSDGTKMYAGTGNSVHQYTLSTAWDISTASYASKSFTDGTNLSNLRGITFKPDGTKVYIGDIGGTPKDVFQYSLSTAWDISTASYDSKTLVVTATVNEFGEFDFNSDGTKVFFQSLANDAVYQYSLSTAYDISTGTYDSISFGTGSQEPATRCFTFGDSGTKFYLAGATNDTVYQYASASYTATLDLSTGSVFELTPTSDIQVSLSNPAASGTVSGATLLLSCDAPTNPYDMADVTQVGVYAPAESTTMEDVTLSTDGTKMYLTATAASNKIYQYTLSTPYDVTTASYDSVSFSATSPTGVAFRSDGLRAYIVGNSTVLYEHSLSSAWDLSTMSSSIDTYNLASWVTTISAVALNPDGTEIFVLDTSGSTVHKVLLSTAWDLTTASHSVTTLNLSAKTTTARSLFITSDGTKLFTDDGTNGKILRYDMSTAFDLSTATFTSEFDHATISTWCGVHLNSDGSKMYAMALTEDDVYQFDVGSGATITYDTTIQWAGGTAPTSPAIGDTDVLTFSTRDGGTTYSAALAIDGAQ